MRKNLVPFYCIMLLAISNITEGQWKLVGTNIIGARREVGKSLYDFGVVTFSNGIIWAGRSELYYSPDTGKNWIFVNTPHYNNYDDIISIDFYNNQIGIICKEYSGFLLTTDRGLSWTTLPKIGGYSSQSIGPPLRLFLFGYSSILLSQDTGKTWLEVCKYQSFGVGSCKTNTPVLMSVADGTSYVTYNRGIQWQQQPGVVSVDTWSLSSDSCITPTIYAANEQLATDGGQPSRLYLSKNFGVTWDIICERPLPFFSGSIEVIGDIIYAQTAMEGVYRSTNKGTTWQSIEGPSCGVDSRCIAIINENTIVAADSSGNIYITENSGGFPITKKKDIAIVQVPQFDTTSCADKLFSKIIISNPNCGTLILDSSDIAGLDRAYFTIESNFPIRIPEGRSDTILVSFDPHSSVGTRNINVKLIGHVSSAYGTRPYDTTVVIIGISRALPPKLTSSSISYNLGTASTCDESRDTVITFRNIGCDTLCITQGPGTLPSEFTIGTLTYPYCLPPDSSVILPAIFVPSSVGTFRAYPKYRAEQQGLTQDLELFLEASGTEGDGEFAYEPKQFDLKTLSICGRDSASGFISNTGCDTLLLSDASLFASGDYTLSSLPAREIIPDDTIRYTVYLNPQQKGTRTGYVVFTTSNRSGARKDSVAITATVTDGTRILASSPNTLDFGTTTLCEERDSIITLRNTGCDTLKVTGVGVQGSGFRVAGGVVPIIIPPGGSIEIPINTIVDTSQGSISTGTITFTSDADNQIPPIPLSRGYTYPKSYSFQLGMPTASGTADDIVRLAIVGEQGLGSAGSNVSRLDFDLALNEDLLEYITYEGSNQVTKNGNQITITNANELTSNNDTLATLRYRVFLTKDSATDITISNVSLNTGDTSHCAPQITAATQAGFSYRYECGDRHIQSFLRTGRASLEITSIRPNPAKNEITLCIKSSARQNASIEIYDLLGTMVIGKQISLENERTDIAIQLHELPEGQYIIRVAAPTGSASRMFTKQVK